MPEVCQPYNCGDGCRNFQMLIKSRSKEERKTDHYHKIGFETEDMYQTSVSKNISGERVEERHIWNTGYYRVILYKADAPQMAGIYSRHSHEARSLVSVYPRLTIVIIGHGFPLPGAAALAAGSSHRSPYRRSYPPHQRHFLCAS